MFGRGSDKRWLVGGLAAMAPLWGHAHAAAIAGDPAHSLRARLTASTAAGAYARLEPLPASGAAAARELALEDVLDASAARPTQLALGPGRTPASPPANVQHLNTTGRPIDVVVPMHEQGPLGEVELRIAPDDTMSVSSVDFTNALSRVIGDDAVARLRAAAGADGFLTFEHLSKLGYSLAYDPGSVDLSVTIPLKDRLTRSIGFGPLEGGGGLRPDKSAPFAAYLNYHSAVIYTISGPFAHTFDYRTDLQLNGRIGPFAFENLANYDAQGRPQFVRDASRVIWDDPKDAIRVTFGDLVTDTAGFQSDPEISGLNFSHLVTTFNPTQAVSGLTSQSLTLQHPADVQVLSNGIPLAEVRLNAGAFNLRDLPAVQGGNHIQLVVTDETGQRQVLNYDFFSDAQLLAPGVDEYSYSFGILAPLQQDGPSYQYHKPAVSGFYRRGWTDQFTAGGNFQISEGAQMMGLDAVWGSRLGLFAIDAAESTIQQVGLGEALRLQYRWVNANNSGLLGQSFDATAQFQSRQFGDGVGFVALGNGSPLAPNNQFSIVSTADFHQPIGPRLRLDLSFNYSKGYSPNPDQYGFGALVTWILPWHTTFGAGVLYEHAPPPVGAVLNPLEEALRLNGWSAHLTFTHQLGPRSRVDAEYQSVESRVDFTRNPGRTIDDFIATADLQHNAASTGVTADLGYVTNRGIADVGYTTAFNPNGSIAEQDARLGLDGSISFAGGKFGIGRHIDDAFAIIDADPSLDSRQVIINSRSAQDVIAKSGLFGPAVVDLPSYIDHLIPYDVKDLPPGYDLGSGAFEVYPWLHAGFPLRVGSPYNITAVGDMVDLKGEPLALRTGTAISLTDKKAPPVEVITNRTGRFGASGLSPGRWRITMSGTPPVAYDVVISKNKDMLVRIGTLRPASSSLGGQ